MIHKSRLCFSSGSEVIAVESYFDNTDFVFKPSAVFGVRNLLAVPYHQQGLLEGFRDVGFGYNDFTLTINLGTASGLANQQSSELRTYPCDETTGTFATLHGEIPSPFPNEVDATWGQPIVVVGASDLTINTVTFTGPTGSVALKAVYGGKPSAIAKADPNQRFDLGKAVIIPENLKTNSSYVAVVNGINKGVAFTKTINFITGGFTIGGYFADVR